VFVSKFANTHRLLPYFFSPPGIFSEYFVAQQDDIFKAPEHLTDAEAAALPLAGLTAYRAVFTKGQVSKGQNVLIAGIGMLFFFYLLA